MERTPFKDSIDRPAIARLAGALAAARASFDAEGFTAAAGCGLGALELKARVRHVAAALRPRLAPTWAEAAAHLVEALPPARDVDAGVGGDFAWWPALQVVEEHGVDEPAVSLAALAELTRVFSGEFAIRPLIERHPGPAFSTLTAWTAHPSAHVRRLVSEGTRPRLPWGHRLRALIADPSPGIALIEALKDDPSPAVRRSVANHLNDVAKDHPDRAVAVAGAWWSGADEARRRVVRHALRGLVKAGHPGALELLGYPGSAEVRASMEVRPAILTLGEALEVVATLRAPADRAVPVLVDLRLIRPTARGVGHKVVKWTTRALEPEQELTLRKRVPIRKISTMRWTPGEHGVELLVNGEVAARGRFTLQLG